MSNTPQPDFTPQGPTYEGRVLPRPEDEVVDQGAGFDVTTMVSRRRVLTLVGLGVGAATLAACAATTYSPTSATSAATTESSPTTDATDSTATTTTTTAAGEIPEETNGPYPADGTNGVNVLEESGIIRSDIRSSLDGGTTVDGVPLTFTFSVTDIAGGDVPFEGAAVYVWHCDAQGLYSMYSEGVEDETFLRGIQVVDANGEATFQTIVPGCYTGRWTHIHFEVYPDVASATDVSNVVATSQVAFPEHAERRLRTRRLLRLGPEPGADRRPRERQRLQRRHRAADGVVQRRHLVRLRRHPRRRSGHRHRARRQRRGGWRRWRAAAVRRRPGQLTLDEHERNLSCCRTSRAGTPSSSSPSSC